MLIKSFTKISSKSYLSYVSIKSRVLNLLFFTIIRLKQREKITFNIFVLISMRIYYFFVS